MSLMIGLPGPRDYTPQAAGIPEEQHPGGTSNVSCGVPCHLSLNASLLAAACELGMNLPITDPTKP